MKNKIQALIITATLFLGANNLVLANNGDLKVGEIKISHLYQLPEEFLLAKIPVAKGEKYTNKELSDIYLALKRLEYISDVNVYPTIVGDVVNLNIEVDERANALEIAKKAEERENLKVKTEYVISGINVNGLNIVDKSVVEPLIPIKVGEYLTPQEAIDGVGKIFSSGYFEKVDLNMERNADNTVIVNYIVEENPIINKITINGNSLFSDEELIAASQIEIGKILNGNLLNPDKNGIIDYYTKAGYSLARIETIELTNGNLDISLTEGIVNSVNFKKRTSRVDNERKNENDTKLRTQNYVFERAQAIKAGEVYQEKKVEATIRELYRTGIFTSIEPVITGSESDPNVRNVDFIVQERPTATINGSISYGTEVGLVGGIKLADANFLGRAQEASLSLEASNKGDKTVEVSLFDPWIKGTERVQGGGSIYFREVHNDNAGPTNVERVNRIGTRWTIGKGLNSDIFVRTSARLDNYKEYFGNKMLSDRYNLAALSPSLVYDTRNNAYNPTKGLYNTLSFETGKLFSRESILGEQGKNYNQFEADLRAYHPTFFKDKNSMAYRVVWGKTSSGTPEALRYSIGGAETIRGYEYGDFDGFDKFYATIENRTQINKALQFVTFFDIGNAWQNETEETSEKIGKFKRYTPNRKAASKFKDLKKGYGIGLRLETPMGPLRFDYGWPMDPVVEGKNKTGGKFYFSFGQTF